MFFGEGVLYILYSLVGCLYVSSSGSIAYNSVWVEIANLSAIVYLQLCGFYWRGSLFLLVLVMGFVILLWDSLSLQYNYFGPLRSAGVFLEVKNYNFV